LSSKEVLVESHDGTIVPLSLVHHEEIEYDGKNPVLLTGYGAYGISMNPRFNPNLLAWIERGGMWAVAHVRGGGEYGDEWHKAGRKETKPNSWLDFIACAEYLIDEGYTCPERLSALGSSAGGITVGRAMTERPELFKAVCIAVGDLNSTRAHLMPSGPANFPEFGNPEDPEEFKYLLEMDSYQHVNAGVAYPAVLLITGINDPKISAWMPSKMAARLRAVTIGRGPILLRVDFAGGHGTQNTKTQRIEATTDALAFCLWQLSIY
jgi:prolyl oligopeptidase